MKYLSFFAAVFYLPTSLLMPTQNSNFGLLEIYRAAGIEFILLIWLSWDTDEVRVIYNPSSIPIQPFINKGINEFNRKICIIVHRAIIECVALLYNELCYSTPKDLRTKWRFRPSTWPVAWKHYPTYKLVWKSMNSSRGICILASKVIIDCGALLHSGILPFGAQGVYAAEWR